MMYAIDSNCAAEQATNSLNMSQLGDVLQFQESRGILALVPRRFRAEDGPALMDTTPLRLNKSR
jgi:hypothetical protein